MRIFAVLVGLATLALLGWGVLVYTQYVPQLVDMAENTNMILPLPMKICIYLSRGVHPVLIVLGLAYLVSTALNTARPQPSLPLLLLDGLGTVVLALIVLLPHWSAWLILHALAEDSGLTAPSPLVLYSIPDVLLAIRDIKLTSGASNDPPIDVKAGTPSPVVLLLTNQGDKSFSLQVKDASTFATTMDSAPAGTSGLLYTAPALTVPALAPHATAQVAGTLAGLKPGRYHVSIRLNLVVNASIVVSPDTMLSVAVH